MLFLLFWSWTHFSSAAFGVYSYFTENISDAVLCVFSGLLSEGGLLVIKVTSGTTLCFESLNLAFYTCHFICMSVTYPALFLNAINVSVIADLL